MANQNFRVKNGLEVGTGVTISGGIVTATSFVGSGSQLTNISAVNYASVSGVSSSVVGGAVSATSLRVTGVTTFNGVVNVRNGYNLNIGDNDDLRIYNDGSNSYIEDTGAGSLNIFGSDIDLKQHSTNKTFARLVGGGAVELYYNDNKKFSTSGAGVTVTGTLVADQLNVSGVVTATTFNGNASSATYATNAGIATAAQGLTGTPDIIVNNINSSGIVTSTSGIVTYYGDTSNTVSGRWTLGASGSSHYTFVGVGFTETTNDPTLYLKRGEVYEFINNSGGSHPFQIRVSNGGAAYNNGVTNNGSASGTIRFEVPYNAPDTLYYQCTNHSSMGGDIIVIGVISSMAQLQVTGISTFVNGPILVGSGTSTGTSAQRLQVTGGAYVSGNLGIGTTNPTEPGISVLGKVLIQQNSNSENRLIFRGQPGSSYRWNIDNYSSSNDFRIFREDDATSANGSVAVSISTTGNLNDGKGNVRAIPQNSQTSAYILAIGDVGKHISITTGGVTINTGIFSAGDAVSIYNNSGSSQTITQGTSVTLRQAGTANTGNRTLAQYGVCTVLCVGSETFVISGAGLS